MLKNGLFFINILKIAVSATGTRSSFIRL